MNNQSFRDLLNKDAPSATKSSARPSALGAKKSSFVPMTPRSGLGNTSSVDFARQVRERNAGLQPTKKFKSSKPMGSKFGAGYTDRAKARADAEKHEETEKTQRIEALKEQVRLGQLSQEDFEDIRVKIVNNDAEAPKTKGLDRALLERTRRGEDILDLPGPDSEQIPSIDVEEELEKLGEKEVQTVKRDTTIKVGNKTTTQIAGVKRSRDEIMTELKAKRQAAIQEKAASVTVFDSSRWRKVGEQAKDKIVIDSKGREVIITVDEDGIVKRKVRKLPHGDDGKVSQKLDKSKPVLGADVAVPELPKSAEPEDSEEDDIFAGVGTEYNPLGEEEDSDGSDTDTDTDTSTSKAPPTMPSTKDVQPAHAATDNRSSRTPEPISKAPKNYFNDSHEPAKEPERPNFQDVENIIKKAAQIGNLQLTEVDEEEKARREKHARMLARDRDLDDMDLGFGSSRQDDEDDGEDGKKPRLSQWKQGDGGSGEDERGSRKKKRKPKKRKGDVDNADDIMRVLEGRRKNK